MRPANDRQTGGLTHDDVDCEVQTNDDPLLRRSELDPKFNLRG